MTKLVKHIIACAFIISAGNVFAASNIQYGTDEIRVGACELKVYTAITPEQKMNGMLGFTDDTFKKDGMIFIGGWRKKHYFHTVGMSMNIRIMGVDRVGANSYEVNGSAIYSPAGINYIEVYGESVFEVSEKFYQERLINCLFKKMSF